MVAGLTADAQAFVLNAAGFCLRALGRMQEAVEPMQAGLQAYISLEEWECAARVAGNLSELYLTLGDLPQALEFGRQSVELADRSGDEFMRMASRANHVADVLHQEGQAEEAAAAFREAEALHKEQFDCPFLNSVQGFRYCDLLLELGEVQEVRTRAAEVIKWEGGVLLSIALDNLSLGRAWLLQAGAGDDGRAADFLQRAVDGLRQAGDISQLPRGLLARAELLRVTGEYERAHRSGRSEAPGRARRDAVVLGGLPSGMGAALPRDGRARAGPRALGDGQRDDRADGLPTARRRSGGDRRTIGLA
jgi:tetratricopeptide (TPR) repeat protein